MGNSHCGIYRTDREDVYNPRPTSKSNAIGARRLSNNVEPLATSTNCEEILRQYSLSNPALNRNPDLQGSSRTQVNPQNSTASFAGPCSNPCADLIRNVNNNTSRNPFIGSINPMDPNMNQKELPPDKPPCCSDDFQYNYGHTTNPSIWLQGNTAFGPFQRFRMGLPGISNCTELLQGNSGNASQFGPNNPFAQYPYGGSNRDRTNPFLDHISCDDLLNQGPYGQQGIGSTNPFHSGKQYDPQNGSVNPNLINSLNPYGKQNIGPNANKPQEEVNPFNSGKQTGPQNDFGNPNLNNGQNPYRQQDFGPNVNKPQQEVQPFNSGFGNPNLNNGQNPYVQQNFGPNANKPQEEINPFNSGKRNDPQNDFGNPNIGNGQYPYGQQEFRPNVNKPQPEPFNSGHLDSGPGIPSVTNEDHVNSPGKNSQNASGNPNLANDQNPYGQQDFGPNANKHPQEVKPFNSGKQSGPQNNFGNPNLVNGQNPHVEKDSGPNANKPQEGVKQFNPVQQNNPQNSSGNPNLTNGRNPYGQQDFGPNANKPQEKVDPFNAGNKNNPQNASGNPNIDNGRNPYGQQDFGPNTNKPHGEVNPLNSGRQNDPQNVSGNPNLNNGQNPYGQQDFGPNSNKHQQEPFNSGKPDHLVSGPGENQVNSPGKNFQNASGNPNLANGINPYGQQNSGPNSNKPQEEIKPFNSGKQNDPQNASGNPNVTNSRNPYGQQDFGPNTNKPQQEEHPFNPGKPDYLESGPGVPRDTNHVNSPRKNSFPGVPVKPMSGGPGNQASTQTQTDEMPAGTIPKGVSGGPTSPNGVPTNVKQPPGKENRGKIPGNSSDAGTQHSPDEVYPSSPQNSGKPIFEKPEQGQFPGRENVKPEGVHTDAIPPNKKRPTGTPNKSPSSSRNGLANEAPTQANESPSGTKPKKSLKPSNTGLNKPSSKKSLKKTSHPNIGEGQGLGAGPQEEPQTGEMDAGTIPQGMSAGPTPNRVPTNVKQSPGQENHDKIPVNSSHPRTQQSPDEPSHLRPENSGKPNFEKPELGHSPGEENVEPGKNKTPRKSLNKNSSPNIEGGQGSGAEPQKNNLLPPEPQNSRKPSAKNTIPVHPKVGEPNDFESGPRIPSGTNENNVDAPGKNSFPGVPVKPMSRGPTNRAPKQRDEMPAGTIYGVSGGPTPNGVSGGPTPNGVPTNVKQPSGQKNHDRMPENSLDDGTPRSPNQSNPSSSHNSGKPVLGKPEHDQFPGGQNVQPEDKTPKKSFKKTSPDDSYPSRPQSSGKSHLEKPEHGQSPGGENEQPQRKNNTPKKSLKKASPDESNPSEPKNSGKPTLEEPEQGQSPGENLQPEGNKLPKKSLKKNSPDESYPSGPQNSGKSHLQKPEESQPPGGANVQPDGKSKTPKKSIKKTSPDELPQNSGKPHSDKPEQGQLPYGGNVQPDGKSKTPKKSIKKTSPDELYPSGPQNSGKPLVDKPEKSQSPAGDNVEPGKNKTPKKSAKKISKPNVEGGPGLSAEPSENNLLPPEPQSSRNPTVKKKIPINKNTPVYSGPESSSDTGFPESNLGKGTKGRFRPLIPSRPQSQSTPIRKPNRDINYPPATRENNLLPSEPQSSRKPSVGKKIPIKKRTGAYSGPESSSDTGFPESNLPKGTKGRLRPLPLASQYECPPARRPNRVASNPPATNGNKSGLCVSNQNVTVGKSVPRQPVRKTSCGNTPNFNQGRRRVSGQAGPYSVRQESPGVICRDKTKCETGVGRLNRKPRSVSRGSNETPCLQEGQKKGNYNGDIVFSVGQPLTSFRRLLKGDVVTSLGYPGGATKRVRRPIEKESEQSCYSHFVPRKNNREPEFQIPMTRARKSQSTPTQPGRKCNSATGTGTRNKNRILNLNLNYPNQNQRNFNSNPFPNRYVPRSMWDNDDYYDDFEPPCPPRPTTATVTPKQKRKPKNKRNCAAPTADQIRQESTRAFKRLLIKPEGNVCRDNRSISNEDFGARYLSYDMYLRSLEQLKLFRPHSPDYGCSQSPGFNHFRDQEPVRNRLGSMSAQPSKSSLKKPSSTFSCDGRSNKKTRCVKFSPNEPHNDEYGVLEAPSNNCLRNPRRSHSSRRLSVSPNPELFNESQRPSTQENRRHTPYKPDFTVSIPCRVPESFYLLKSEFDSYLERFADAIRAAHEAELANLDHRSSTVPPRPYRPPTSVQQEAESRMDPSRDEHRCPLPSSPQSTQTICSSGSGSSTTNASTSCESRPCSATTPVRCYNDPCNPYRVYSVDQLNSNTTGGLERYESPLDPDRAKEKELNTIDVDQLERSGIFAIARPTARNRFIYSPSSPRSSTSTLSRDPEDIADVDEELYAQTTNYGDLLARLGSSCSGIIMRQLPSDDDDDTVSLPSRAPDFLDIDIANVLPEPANEEGSRYWSELEYEADTEDLMNEPMNDPIDYRSSQQDEEANQRFLETERIPTSDSDMGLGNAPDLETVDYEMDMDDQMNDLLNECAEIVNRENNPLFSDTPPGAASMNTFDQVQMWVENNPMPSTVLNPQLSNESPNNYFGQGNSSTISNVLATVDPRPESATSSDYIDKNPRVIIKFNEELPVLISSLRKPITDEDNESDSSTGLTRARSRDKNVRFDPILQTQLFIKDDFPPENLESSSESDFGIAEVPSDLITFPDEDETESSWAPRANRTMSMTSFNAVPDENGGIGYYAAMSRSRETVSTSTGQKLADQPSATTIRLSSSDTAVNAEAKVWKSASNLSVEANLSLDSVLDKLKAESKAEEKLENLMQGFPNELPPSDD